MIFSSQPLRKCIGNGDQENTQLLGVSTPIATHAHLSLSLLLMNHSLALRRHCTSPSPFVQVAPASTAQILVQPMDAYNGFFSVIPAIHRQGCSLWDLYLGFPASFLLRNYNWNYVICFSFCFSFLSVLLLCYFCATASP